MRVDRWDRALSLAPARRDRKLDLAAPLLEKALLIDPNSAWAWQRSERVSSHSKRSERVDRSLSRRAARLASSSAFFGWLNMYLDNPEVSIEHFERSLRLSPLQFIYRDRSRSFSCRPVRRSRDVGRKRPARTTRHRLKPHRYRPAPRRNKWGASSFGGQQGRFL